VVVGHGEETVWRVLEKRERSVEVPYEMEIYIRSDMNMMGIEGMHEEGIIDI